MLIPVPEPLAPIATPSAAAGVSAGEGRRFQRGILVGVVMVVLGIGIGVGLGLKYLVPAVPVPQHEPVFAALPTASKEATTTAPFPPPPPAVSPVPPPPVVPDTPRSDVAKAADEAYQKGRQALQRDDLMNAIAAFSEAIRLEPKFAAAYGWRGVCYLRKGDRQTALADLDEAISLNGDDPEPRLCRAEVLIRENKHLEAITECEAVLQLDGKRVEAYFLKGRCQAALRRWHDATATYTDLIRINPKNAAAYARVPRHTTKRQHRRPISATRMPRGLREMLADLADALGWIPGKAWLT